MMEDIHRGICATIAFFDLFSHPLTPWELWKWHYRLSSGDAPSFDQVSNAVEQLIGMNILRSSHGFVFCGGHEHFIAERNKRYRDSYKKFQRAIRAARILAMIPFIRSIAVSNTLSYSNARSNGDIDFFIIVQKNRLWISRFLAASLFQLLRKRPTDTRRANAICLSFWVTEEQLNLSSVRISDDVYLEYWIAQLYPVFDQGEWMKRFFKSNEWIARHLPNSNRVIPHHSRFMRQNRWERFMKHCLELVLSGAIGNGLERAFARVQKKYFPESIHAQMNRGTSVIATNTMLKFHTKDQRQRFSLEWKSLLRVLCHNYGQVKTH